MRILSRWTTRVFSTGKRHCANVEARLQTLKIVRTNNDRAVYSDMPLWYRSKSEPSPLLYDSHWLTKLNETELASKTPHNNKATITATRDYSTGFPPWRFEYLNLVWNCTKRFCLHTTWYIFIDFLGGVFPAEWKVIPWLSHPVAILSRNVKQTDELNIGSSVKEPTNNKQQPFEDGKDGLVWLAR